MSINRLRAVQRRLYVIEQELEALKQENQGLNSELALVTGMHSLDVLAIEALEQENQILRQELEEAQAKLSYHNILP